MYTNKEFCTLTGITNETLRHYLKRGILSPTKTLENGYRLYSDLDALKVLEVRFFRGYDIRISDISSQLSMDFEEYSSWIVERYHELEDEINQKLKILKRFKIQIQNHNALLQHPIGKPFLSTTENPVVAAVYDGTSENAKRVEALSMDFPHSFPLIQFDLSAPSNSTSYRVGAGTVKDRELSYEDEGYIRLEGPRVYMATNVPDFSKLTRDVFDPMIDYVHYHNFIPKGEINCAVIHISQNDSTISGTISASLCLASDEPGDKDPRISICGQAANILTQS